MPRRTKALGHSLLPGLFCILLTGGCHEPSPEGQYLYALDDQADLTLPKTTWRQEVPGPSAVITLDRSGVLRAALKDDVATLIAPSELPTFLAKWRQEFSTLDIPVGGEPLPDTPEVTLTHGNCFCLDWHTHTTLSDLANRLATHPGAEVDLVADATTYGDLVHILEELYALSVPEIRLFPGEAVALRLRSDLVLSSPTLTIKADKAAPLSYFLEVAHAAASAGVPSLVLVTDLALPETLTADSGAPDTLPEVPAGGIPVLLETLPDNTKTPGHAPG